MKQQNVVAFDQILQNANVWRGRELQETDYEGIASGFEALDAELYGNGWPQGSLMEVLSDQRGIGELQILMPALAKLSQEGRWLAWIAPPHVPYAPALAVRGVDLSKVLWVHPKKEDDMLWAVEQALRSGTCGAVLVWSRLISDRNLRRLQLAAEEGNTLGVMFRPRWVRHHASPAALRIHLEPTMSGEVAVRILKRRGGWSSGDIPMQMPLDMPLDMPLGMTAQAKRA
jgi:cell division inhibitor SulA/protein ImuA